MWEVEATTLIAVPNCVIIRDSTGRPVPLMRSTGESEVSGPVIGKDSRRHNLRGSPYSRKIRQIGSPLGREKKAHDKAYIKYCCRRSQICCEWGDSKNYIGNKNHPCIQKWILPSANTGKYCLILACPLFHSKETVVHAVRPHYPVTVLISAVILGWCHQGHCWSICHLGVDLKEKFSSSRWRQPQMKHAVWQTEGGLDFSLFLTLGWMPFHTQSEEQHSHRLPRVGPAGS